MNFKMIKRGAVIALATLILTSPMSALAKKTNALDQKTTTQDNTYQRIPYILINGKVSNNKNKLNLDSNENYITLKGKYKNCNLKTNSKKIKIRYWGNLGKTKEWEVITKKCTAAFRSRPHDGNGGRWHRPRRSRSSTRADAGRRPDRGRWTAARASCSAAARRP